MIDYRNAEVFVEQIPDVRRSLLIRCRPRPMVEVPEESAQLFRELLTETR